MGFLLLHEAGHIFRVAGGDDRIARLDQGVPDVSERLVVVVHRQDADLFPGRPARWSAWKVEEAGGGETNPDSSTVGRVKVKRAPRPGPSLVGPYPAPVGFHDPLADRQAQSGVPSLLLSLYAGELPKQVRQVLGPRCPFPRRRPTPRRGVHPAAALTLIVDDSVECLAALVSKLPSTWTMREPVRHDPGQVRQGCWCEGCAGGRRYGRRPRPRPVTDRQVGWFRGDR